MLSLCVFVSVQNIGRSIPLVIRLQKTTSVTSFCEICKNTFFAEHHRTTASYYTTFYCIAVSIVVKGELANENVNYDAKLKYMYQLSQKCKLSKGGSPAETWTGCRSSRLQIFFKISFLKCFAKVLIFHFPEPMQHTSYTRLKTC